MRPSLEDVDYVLALVRAIRPVLVGQGPAVQGAVLANLLAIWLVSHVADGDKQAGLVDQLINMHIGTVRELLPIYREEVLARYPDKKGSLM